LFEYVGSTNKFYQVESEKQKDHEKPITGLDYNRKMGLIASSCQQGIIKIWSLEKRFIREIVFPHKVESICFYNDTGDLLISHEQRVSLLLFKTYSNKCFGQVMLNT
jgi:WD40 repeat protein